MEFGFREFFQKKSARLVSEWKEASMVKGKG